MSGKNEKYYVLYNKELHLIKSYRYEIRDEFGPNTLIDTRFTAIRENKSQVTASQYIEYDFFLNQECLMIVL